MRYTHPMLFVILAGLAPAATSAAQAEVTTELAAQRQQQLAGVRARLSQLRNEQAMNKVAINGGKLPPNVMASLQARGKQLNSEIDALLAQERALTQ
jgi:hypothetical protein